MKEYLFFLCRWLYWIEAGENPTICRKILNGEFYQVLVDSNLESPSGLTINFLTGMLYWGDIGRIEEFDLIKLNRSTYYINPDIIPFQITTVREFIIFTVNEMTKYGVFKVGANLLTMIRVQSGSLVYGIIALSQSKEPTKGTKSNSECKNGTQLFIS